MEDEIVNGNVYFSSMDDFNDPNEGRATANYTYDQKMFSDWLKGVRRVLMKANSKDYHILLKETEKYENDKLYIEWRKKYLKTPLSDIQTKTIMAKEKPEYFAFLNKQLIIAMDESELEMTADLFFKQYNIPTQKIMYPPYIFQKMHRRTTVVSCYSKRFFCPYMFALYAENHQGICIEYEFVKSDEDLVREVEYVNGLPNITKEDFISGFEGLIRKLIFTKTNVWEKEEEVRVVTYPAKAGPKPIKDVGGSIKRICLGVRMQESNKEKVKDWARAKRIPVMQAEIDEDCWKFAIESCD